MKPFTQLFSLLLVALAALSRADAQTTAVAPPLPFRTQVVQLQKGWNAVWLEVEPLAGKPDEVFKDTGVDIAARYLLPVTSAQFITDPLDTPWNQPGWGVWYAPHRRDAFIRSLHHIEGNAAYLLHATRDMQWSVEGTVTFRRMKWTHNTFTLAGFSLDPVNPPTFGSFFASTEGRIGQTVYRLTEGRWAKLSNAAATPMRPGEACWIFCNGQTDFQGPLDVRLPGMEVLDFSEDSSVQTVQYVNASGHRAPLVLELAAAGSTAVGGLKLHQDTADLSTLTKKSTVLTGSSTLPELDAGFARQLRLSVDRSTMTASAQTALLSLTCGGQRIWIPARATKP